MLDVHTPHAATHTWKDFFIHIATIVIGLLIAVALEQTVEFVHHHNERVELREALIHEAETAKEDTEMVHVYAESRVQMFDAAIAAVQTALDSKQVLQYQLPKPSLTFEAPDDPVWTAAKSSGVAELLPQREIEAFSELDGSILYAERYHIPMNNTARDVNNFNRRFQRAGSTVPDYATADRDELKEYLRLLIAARSEVVSYEYWSRSLHGAAVVIVQGERDLRKIQDAEGRHW